MGNIEIPAEAWQAIQARVVLDSSEEVSWPGKAIGEFLGESYEMDVTYHARYYQGRLWLDMTAPYLNVPPSTLTVPSNQQEESMPLFTHYQPEPTSWSDIPEHNEEWPKRIYKHSYPGTFVSGNWSATLSFAAGQQATSWQELRAPSGNGYLYKYFPSGSRRKRKSPARMSRKWRELRKEWH